MDIKIELDPVVEEAKKEAKEGLSNLVYYAVLGYSRCLDSKWEEGQKMYQDIQKKLNSIRNLMKKIEHKNE